MFIYQANVVAMRNVDLCPVQDIEVVIDWFSAVMWGAIKMSNSPIGGASEF